MEMSYPRGACGVTRWDGESNESVYERERCYQRGRAGSSKEGVFGQGVVETFSAVATPLEDVAGGARRQSYR